MGQPVIWRDDHDAPIAWFVHWLRKARICNNEQDFTDEQINALFVMWLDGYSEDAAVETLKAGA